MIEFKVPAMSCGHCVQAVMRAVQSVDPRAEVRVDLASKTVAVESATDRPQLAAALADAGYPPQ